MRRRVPTKRGGKRQVVSAGAGDDTLALDNRPLGLQVARDGKRLLVTLPYEVWVINAATREVERTLELPGPNPTPFESESEGALWIGGRHLFAGSLWNNQVTKVGTRLGGYVDSVGLLRPTLLCGVGSGGEILWDTEKEEVLHRRRASERRITGFVVSPDGRALFSAGTSAAWVLDPEHPTGHMQLHFRATSEVEVPGEAIVQLGQTTTGRSLLAAADGAVAWTNRALRVVGEVVPREAPGETLALGGDGRHIYALRGGGVLDRFLIAQPEPTDDDPEPAALPEAETVRLSRAASALAVDPESGALWLAGPTSGGYLGRVWSADAAALQWAPLRLGKRTLTPAPDPEAADAKAAAPSFVTTRNKVSGDPISSLRVDDVLGHNAPFYLTASTGNFLDRSCESRASEDILPADALLLGAMVRFKEGTARPALVYWPGRAGDGPLEDTTILVWGDDPRGWIVLDTPAIRAQGWTRAGVFPLQVALGAAPPDVAGRRVVLPKKWADPELFAALARECKKLLKVLW